ncbi:hypothetical protein DIS24_g7000 [Lasiodiplodia hormozganensis]|uniref:Uncharacterized protein n=1 Tax=Lasiodiplodia hormozganensis TaxID=869390 RepID=A0AA39YCP4_9PEZI|nr:hypothetical protein DIS24_g7000 [Lasiodiplodia hormozganensis]
MPPHPRSTPSSTTTLLLIASALLVQLDLTHALPVPRSSTTPTLITLPPTTQPTNENVFPIRHQAKQVALPFGHPGPAGADGLLPDAADVAAAAGHARATGAAQGPAGGPGRRVIAATTTLRRTRTITLPVIAVADLTTATATTTTAAVVTITSVEEIGKGREEEEKEKSNEKELPRPVLPPTLLMLPMPEETLLLDSTAAVATAAPTKNPFANADENDRQENTHATSSQPLYNSKLGALIEDTPQNRQHAFQQFLELGDNGDSGGSKGGHGPKRQEMGRGSGSDNDIVLSVSSGGATASAESADGGAPTGAVTTEKEEIDATTDDKQTGQFQNHNKNEKKNNNNKNYDGLGNGGGGSSGINRLWKDEV